MKCCRSGMPISGNDVIIVSERHAARPTPAATSAAAPADCPGPKSSSLCLSSSVFCPSELWYNLVELFGEKLCP